MIGNDEWYERRLVEETGKLRVELAEVETRRVGRIASVEARLIERSASGEAASRKEIAATEMRLNDRITSVEIALRQEIAATELRLVREIASVREAIHASQSTMTRWMCGFWVGQFAGLAGLLVILR
jgi:hypothetical protein